MKLLHEIWNKASYKKQRVLNLFNFQVETRSFEKIYGKFMRTWQTAHVTNLWTKTTCFRRCFRKRVKPGERGHRFAFLYPPLKNTTLEFFVSIRNEKRKKNVFLANVSVSFDGLVLCQKKVFTWRTSKHFFPLISWYLNLKISLEDILLEDWGYVLDSKVGSVTSCFITDVLGKLLGK